MATIIKLKRGTTTPTTSDLSNGEVGIDTSNQKFYINDNGTIKEIGGSAGGGNAFTTIALSDSSIVADSSTDTLTISTTGLITAAANADSDTLTLGTASTATIPFTKADGSPSNIDLQTSGTIDQVITNLYIPFTIADGSAVETLVVGSS
jgi:hypothetical protein